MIHFFSDSAVDFPADYHQHRCYFHDIVVAASSTALSKYFLDLVIVSEFAKKTKPLELMDSLSLLNVKKIMPVDQVHSIDLKVQKWPWWQLGPF